jgi:hypothetical protein
MYFFLAAAATSTAATEEVPTDPTAYYNDYWQYASYYGQAAARVYYGAWSPPEGTPIPAGMTIPADPVSDSVVTNNSNGSQQNNSGNTADDSAKTSTTKVESSADIDPEVIFF